MNRITPPLTVWLLMVPQPEMRHEVWAVYRLETEKKNHVTHPKLTVNLSATDFFFQILAHSLFEMRVIQKPNKVPL